MTAYTLEEARRIILAGKAKGPMTVEGRLGLRGCTGLTTLPDGLAVKRWFDLSGCTGLTLPTSWISSAGVKVRCLAICPRDGYMLMQPVDATYSAGCRRSLSRDEALKHWDRTDGRAKIFTAAILANVLPDQVAT